MILDQETLKMLSDYVLALNTPEDQPVFFYKTNASIQPRKKIWEYGRSQDTSAYTPHIALPIHMVRQGTDLRRVQLMLGHSSLSITQVYLQFNDNDLREAYEKVAF